MDEIQKPEKDEQEQIIPPLGGGMGPAIFVVLILLVGYLVYQAYLFFFG